MSTEKKSRNCNLEFRGGIECTINRVNNIYFDQLNLSRHYRREEDIRLISELGIKTLRYPVLWEKHAPAPQHAIDWTFTKSIIWAKQIRNYAGCGAFAPWQWPPVYKPAG